MIGELIEWLPILCKENGIDHKKEVRLILAEALGNILSMLGEGPRAKAFANETLIWTCGIRGTQFCENLPITDGKIGRKLVNEFMQSPDYDNVYVVGDGMWHLEDNRAVLQIVEAAEQTAKTAADSITYAVKSELGLKAKEPKPFKSNFHGYMISIGGTWAVSHTAGIAMTGFFAMALKHLVNIYYQAGVAGVNAAWAYIKHEILEIKNRRSLIGGLAEYKVPSYWTTFLRMYLGVMWLIEGVQKVTSGWLSGRRHPRLSEPGSR